MRKLACLAVAIAAFAPFASAENGNNLHPAHEGDDNVIVIYMPLERATAKDAEIQHAPKSEDQPKTEKPEPPKTQQTKPSKNEDNAKKKSDPAKDKKQNTPSSGSEPTGTKPDSEDLGIPTRLYRPRFRNSAEARNPQHTLALLAIILVSALAVF